MNIFPAHPVSSRNPNSPKFGWNMGVDVGVSIGPNEKVTLYDDQWQKVGGTDESKVILPTPCQPAGQTNLMLSNMAKVMNTVLENFWNKLPEQQKTGNSLIFFMPGQQINNVVDEIYNIPETVKNADMKRIPGLMSQLRGQRTPVSDQPVTNENNHDVKNSSLFANPVRILTLNDVMGGMAASMEYIAKMHPEKFKPGTEAIFMMPGGGVGTGRVEYLKPDGRPGYIRLEASELGSLPVCIRKLDGEFKVRDRGNLEGLMTSFSEALPERYSLDARKAISQNKNGKIATDYNEAHKVLPDLTVAEHTIAAQKACRDFMASLASIIQINITLGGNLAIVAGKIRGGVRNYVNTHPEVFSPELQQYQSMPKFNAGQRCPFDQAFLATIWNQLDYKEQFVENKFDIITDLPIRDNTEGAPYVAQGWYELSQNRYVIPESAFSKKV